MTISLETRHWLALNLTAHEIETWGANTIRALAALFDGLTISDKEHHP